MGNSSRGLEHFVRQDRPTFEVGNDFAGACRAFLKASRLTLAGLKQREAFPKRSAAERAKAQAARRRRRRVEEAIRRQQGA